MTNQFISPLCLAKELSLHGLEITGKPSVPDGPGTTRYDDHCQVTDCTNSGAWTTSRDFLW